MHTGGTRDVDDVPWLTVLHSEIWCGCTYNLERRGSVKIDNSVPLLVGHLVDDTVPCVSSIVHDDVNLAAAELGRLLDENFDVFVVKDIACYSDGTAA